MRIGAIAVVVWIKVLVLVLILHEKSLDLDFWKAMERHDHTAMKAANCAHWLGPVC